MSGHGPDPNRGRSRSGGRPRKGGPARGTDAGEEPREPAPPEPQYEWVDEGRVERSGRARPSRSKGSSRSPGRRRKPVPVAAPELGGVVGKERARRLEGRIEDAARAFAADRYIDARRTLKPIAEEVPDSPEVRELYGLTLYRLGKWRQAAGQLEAFVVLTGGSVEQHPVLADCYRALGRYDRVDALWAELRDVSPSAELVTEGRIVVAGSLADRGRLSDAVALLSKGFKLPARFSEFHLRRAYALADLYERSGDVPQARQLFGRIASMSPGYLDVEERLDNLG